MSLACSEATKKQENVASRHQMEVFATFLYVTQQNQPQTLRRDLVMIFPIWWMSTPAMTKGFIDKVIFPGMVYKMEGGKLVSMLTHLKQVVIITTMNTPAAIYESTFGNSVEGSLIKGTFNQIGIHDIRWISLNMVKQVGDEKRWLWLDEIEHEFAAE